MGIKLFKKKEIGDSDLPQICRFCERATIISDERNVLCSDRGIVSAEYRCRKFSYDLLKRAPKILPPPHKFDPSDPGIEIPTFIFGEAFSIQTETEPDGGAAAAEPETPVLKADEPAPGHNPDGGAAAVKPEAPAQKADEPAPGPDSADDTDVPPSGTDK